MSSQSTKTDTITVVSKVVEANLSNLRKSRAKTKKRGEVSGGGKKPFRQKGTGRARAGSNRSPIWRGGGVTFGPQGNENYQKNVNKKEKILAKNAAFEARKGVIINLDMPKIGSTKEAAKFIEKNNLKKPLLILASEETSAIQSNNLKRYFRNIQNVQLTNEVNTNTYEILKAANILILKEMPKKKTVKSKAPKGKK